MIDLSFNCSRPGRVPVGGVEAAAGSGVTVKGECLTVKAVTTAGRAPAAAPKNSWNWSRLEDGGR